MPGTFEDINCISPTPTTSSSGGDAAHDSKDFKDYGGRSWSRNSRSSSALDRHSESSDSLDNQSTSSGNGRHLQDFGSTEVIATRTKGASPKVAYNPMQFVKTAPPKLVTTAQEQLKKADQIKKIRETNKDDAEEWQANLEGWKSSRRKRQEHVIERVTEVKRMEQEEALKASEAAAKRLLQIREKRGKLTALYSSENNDQIEFDQICQPDPVPHDTGSHPPDISTATDKPTSVVEPGPDSGTDASATGNKPQQQKPQQQQQEYTYDKAIEDYVKFTNAARSNAATVNAHTRSVSPSLSIAVKRSVSQAEVTNVRAETTDAKSGDNSDGVLKRRSLFERSNSSEEKDNSGFRSANTGRKSGDFSSTFKNRLSTFEGAESNACTALRVTPERDPDFRNKLASFHQPPEAVQKTIEVTKPEAIAEGVEEEQLNFQAKLAAFRQVEKSAPEVKKVPEVRRVNGEVKRVPVTPARSTEVAVKPPLPVCNSVSLMTSEPEPIYVNSSVKTTATSDLVYTDGGPKEVVDAPIPAEADDSDCTEDEGIRSLSPHGTPSPSSPTLPEPLPESTALSELATLPESPSVKPVQPSATGTTSAFFQPSTIPKQLDQVKDGFSNPSEEKEVVVAPENDSASAWSSTEVWDGSTDWVVGVTQNVAPPSEKPPPPPLPSSEDDLPLPTEDQQAVEETPPSNSGSSGPSGPSSNYRKEWRQRRSDFLGFDIKSVEDDASEMAAIVPPPSLKSLLRSGGALDGFRTSDLPGMADWEPPSGEEEELARQERRIIETLEEEEQKKKKIQQNELEAPVAPEVPAGSLDGSADFEMTAEIDQLAREWQATTNASGRKQEPSKFNSAFHPVDSVVVDSTQHQVAATPAELVRSASNKETGYSPPSAGYLPPASPSKNRSTLSAAPKPRLHDGESWMAKRKLAVEGGRKEKDVSRHWLIQEAEQRRIDAANQRHQFASPLSGTSSTATPPNDPTSDNWLSRSSSSISMDQLSEPRLHQCKDQSRSASSLSCSPTLRPLYANQDEILEFADFTGAPHSAPPVWQVRSLNSGSMDQLQCISAPSRPFKLNQQSRSFSHLAPNTANFNPNNPSQHATMQPNWRSTTHPPEVTKEPIAPLPHSVIETLTQRMSQRQNGNNYGDYMNICDAAVSSSTTRAGPQVPAQRPINYRHPSLGATQSAPASDGSTGLSPQGNNNGGDRMLSVSGKKKCSLCLEELGRGAAMIIESLRLFYHIGCFRCCVCGIALGNGTAGTDVRVRNNHLHCHDCYSNDDGLKFSKV